MERVCMLKTRQIPQSDYVIYEKKADQAFQAMLVLSESKLWTPVGREAVFTCINITDALLARHKQLRNISKDHMSILKVMSLLPIKEASKQENRLRKVIVIKNLVDYENKDFTTKQAEDVMKNAERFYKWGKEHL